MIQVPPVIAALVKDPTIGRADARVFLFLCERLDVVDYREVTLVSLAHDTKMSEANLSRSVQRLCDGGYLKRGERSGSRGPWTYRIPYSPDRRDEQAIQQFAAYEEAERIAERVASPNLPAQRRRNISAGVVL